ncbi:Uncharacterized protein APZ42_017545 [Daphnia magna]|uniref:Uncharacterized protein n=1 Tax=Daphnia magna TaxID=35525 RepID=A0A164ZXN5_9CRUS|nr:Uncharacterized protein APZ42_017545 [Daphnia magna]
MEADFVETQVLIRLMVDYMLTWQLRNMPCSILLKSRRRKKNVLF